MACVENMQPITADSEMEEGEIVDDLSDISSEEEFLLRQRLQVLENYNNVLERKKAKRSSVGPGTKHKKEDTLLYDLSEISATELEDYNCTQTKHKNIKEQRHIKTHHRQKIKKEEPVNSFVRNKDYKKKNHRNKRKLEVKVISESSDESEDEYRNRRRKLADAVLVKKDKNDQTLNEKSSLSARLKKMLCPDVPEPVKFIFTENKTTTDIYPKINNHVFSPISNIDNPVTSPIPSLYGDDHILGSEIQEINKTESVAKNPSEPIDLCTDDDAITIASSEQAQDTVDYVTEAKHIKPSDNHSDKDSDEDLELLRQHALKTKIPKPKMIVEETIQSENKMLSEDEDSDTAELRLICLKSALLKKAIEMKRKQKLRKRLSQSSNLRDELLDDQDMFAERNDSENNTDIESVDMEIGSDVDEKSKEITNGSTRVDNLKELNVTEDPKALENNISDAINNLSSPKEEELEEDEDLLRAKLLTSLSKNLSSLVNPNIIKTIDKIEDTAYNIPKPPQVDNIPEEKRFIIKLGESDSEGEHEATKNLTKMHVKLSEQIDFQQRLDVFLKSTRKSVENSTAPDEVQKPITPKKNEKFVAKAVKHLPKSEQIEYKNLVKRMAELEKMKQARQSIMMMPQKPPMKDTLKPRNVTIDTAKLANNLDEQINLSRKKIAEESSKMLKLKDEGKKMSQKFKIVATELRNIKTALALNRKQQIIVQNYLNKIRVQHQMLLKSSTPFKHSKINGHLPSRNLHNPSLQKENNPAKDEYKNPLLLKTVKVSIANDIKAEPKPPLKPTHPRLSVQIDVNGNKKVLNIPNAKSDSEKTNGVEDRSYDLNENTNVSGHPVVEKGGGNNKETEACDRNILKDVDDYKSPLDALGNTEWEGDPNAILCPFEVDGDCKDPDCKYLHTKTHSQ